MAYFQSWIKTTMFFNTLIGPLNQFVWGAIITKREVNTALYDQSQPAISHQIRIMLLPDKVKLCLLESSYRSARLCLAHICVRNFYMKSIQESCLHCSVSQTATYCSSSSRGEKKPKHWYLVVFADPILKGMHLKIPSNRTLLEGGRGFFESPHCLGLLIDGATIQNKKEKSLVFQKSTSSITPCHDLSCGIHPPSQKAIYWLNWLQPKLVTEEEKQKEPLTVFCVWHNKEMKCTD